MKFTLDTGAVVSLCRCLPDQLLKGAGEKPLHVTGTADAKITSRSNPTRVPIHVLRGLKTIRGSKQALLGVLQLIQFILLAKVDSICVKESDHVGFSKTFWKVKKMLNGFTDHTASDS